MTDELVDESSYNTFNDSPTIRPTIRTMKDLYKILGIEKIASPEEIKKAYFVMAKKYHPDSADRSEVQKFYEVAEAYQILSDAEERKAYDLVIGGGKIESVLVEDEPSHPTIFKESRDTTGVDEDFRKKEMNKFKRRILWQGIFRTIGFSILMSVFGYAISFVLEGIWYVGLVCGFVIGLIWSINRNFDVKSFIVSPKKQRVIKIIGWTLLIGGVGYFVWLLISKFL